MPHLGGYSVYVHAPLTRNRDEKWLVRTYRDIDGEHVHTSERCDSLEVGMREAERAINEDLEKRREYTKSHV